MPIVFAQPAPAGQISRISQQGNLPAYLSAYSSLAATAQNAYNQQGETAARERLGYANLHADTALRMQALGQRQTEAEMEIASRHAAIQQRAQLELDDWVQKQRFNARDQEELTRQQNSLSELITKVQSGEISEEEYYHQATGLAPRVNALVMKDAHTKAQAQAEQAKAMADFREQQKASLQLKDQWMNGEVGAATEVVVLPEKLNEMAGYMQTVHPELRPGTAEYQNQLKADASELGFTVSMVRQNGKLQSLKDFSGKTAGATGGKGEVSVHDTDAAVSAASREADQWARQQFTATGQMPGADAIEKQYQLYKKRYEEARGPSPVERQKAVEQERQTALSGVSERKKSLDAMGFSGEDKKRASVILDQIEKLIKSPHQTKAVNEKIDQLTKMFQGLQTRSVMRAGLEQSSLNVSPEAEAIYQKALRGIGGFLNKAPDRPLPMTPGTFGVSPGGG